MWSPRVWWQHIQRPFPVLDVSAVGWLLQISDSYAQTRYSAGSIMAACRIIRSLVDAWLPRYPCRINLICTIDFGCGISLIFPAWYSSPQLPSFKCQFGSSWRHVRVNDMFCEINSTVDSRGSAAARSMLQTASSKHRRTSRSLGLFDMQLFPIRTHEFSAISGFMRISFSSNFTNSARLSAWVSGIPDTMMFRWVVMSTL